MIRDRAAGRPIMRVETVRGDRRLFGTVWERDSSPTAACNTSRYCIHAFERGAVRAELQREVDDAAQVLQGVPRDVQLVDGVAYVTDPRQLAVLTSGAARLVAYDASGNEVARLGERISTALVRPAS